MDFFGFHPAYVVILLALALIIFGPSRLPKMGAQMGRMLREFQAAREGLTQQMREAFEEESESSGTSSATVETASVGEEEPEPASEGSAVAVLDPPPGGQTTPEAMGTATDGVEGPWEGFSPVEAAAPDEGVTAEEPETAAALSTPAETVAAAEPETVAATPGAPAEEAPAEEPETAVLSTPAEAVTAEEPETVAAAPADPAEEAPAEEPETAASLQPPTEAEARAADVPGSDSVAPPVTGDAPTEAPEPAAGNPFAWVAADHEPAPPSQDEEAREE